ncbi:MAG: DUF86 domain-containing protein [Anaerolineales bacterium]|nr:DUF86 domain-containing protein [Anaerolineales bacterium]
MKNQQRIADMVAAIEAIESYAISTYEQFIADHKTQDGVMYNLIIMGEAANRVSTEFQERHPQVPWSSIIGTRNVIVHGYDQVKLQIVWQILQKELSQLKEKLKQILADIAG